MGFVLLLTFSALFVAGCAAFFSIKGLVILFSGSALAIAIMASSLEIGKLVAASFLHRYWSEISFLLKSYLCVAVAVLMAITSMGIFGFLTNAYQLHAATVETFENVMASKESERDTVFKTTEEVSNRIKALNEIRIAQEQRVQEAGNYKLPREQAYEAIRVANTEMAQKEQQLHEARERLIAIDKQIADIKIQMSTKTDVGSFKFIASALGTDVDTAVKIFILSLVFVFDPLAVSLVLALNVLIEKRAKKNKLIPSQKNAEHNVSPLSTATTFTTSKKSEVEDSQHKETPEELLRLGRISESEYRKRIVGGYDNSVVTL
jgi:hypothetical protein